MSKAKVFLTIDLGAESGRAVGGVFDGKRLRLEELHRFPNGAVSVGGELHWDVLRLYGGIKDGIARAVTRYGKSIASIGVDTWGVDYCLLDKRGSLLGNPFHYRDGRTRGMEEEANRRLPRRKIYEQTGIQFMFFNTLLQVLSESVHKAPALAVADRLLFIPDLINYWLTGKKVNERTIASTSQMLNPRTGRWATAMLRRLGIPTAMLGEVVEPGTDLGVMLPAVSAETGARGVRVIAPGCHDTASAVAAVPAKGGDHAYVSSGTWSLMGVESAKPIITDTSFKFNFTNEGGVCGTTRVLKNICGLWLVQECKRTWSSQGDELGYAELTRMAAQARAFTALVDPDAAIFSTPGDMPARIAEYCRKSGQREPRTKGEIVRTALESLALRYRATLHKLEELGGARIPVVHIVGGGTQNKLLNQFAASATGRPVVTGPVEATSAGNILMQMLATGHISGLREGRDIIRGSFDTETWQPKDTGAWDDAFAKLTEAQQKIS